MDETSLEGRIIKATLDLASERAWRDISLLDIAERAGCTLRELRDAYRSKSEIVRSFSDQIDSAILGRPSPRMDGETVRDKIFEIVMCRFDALSPFKVALRSISLSGDLDPAMAVRFLESQRWMLHAAGVSRTGCSGMIRTLGFAGVYASVFRIWLDDQDPGMGKTMAALDRQLRRGEQLLLAVDEISGALERLCSGLGPGRRRTKASEEWLRPNVPSDQTPQSTPGQ